jgi:hypothetical protein
VVKRKRQTSVPNPNTKWVHKSTFRTRAEAAEEAREFREYGAKVKIQRVTDTGWGSFGVFTKAMNASNPRSRAYAKNPAGFRPKKKSRTRPVGKRAAATRRKVANATAVRKNPPMKRLKKSTGWMSATAVKIVKRGGQMDVLIRKPAGKKSKRR